MERYNGCGTSGRRPTRGSAVLRRVRMLLTAETGIGLIETMIALTIFAVVSTALIGSLVSATSDTKFAKDKTIAEEGTASEVEMIKNWAATPYPNGSNSPTYKDIGTNPSGNPYGLLPQSQVFSGVNGESLGTPAHMTISVDFESANVPGAYTNGIDYKQVTVTITRDVDSHVLSSITAFVAPPQRAAGNTATINATIADYDTKLGVPGAGLALGTGPSAPRSDTSDSLGQVSFAGLTANPTSGGQAYYDLTVTPPTGYAVLSDTVSPNAAAHFQLAPSQTYPTTLYIYQPVTAGIALFYPDGSAYTGNASVTITSSRGTATMAYAGAPITFTALSNGELLVPGLLYTVTATQANFTASAPPATVVPTGTYPTSLTSSFSLTMTPTPGTIKVTVSRSGTACKNATVTITGGPNGGTLSGTTSSTGVAATISNVPANYPGATGSTTYTVVGKSVVTNVSATVTAVTVTSATTTNVTVALASGSTTC